MALADEVKTRMGGSTSSRLRQLTNDDGTQGSINDTVLTAACNDAIAEFQRITGLAFDLTNATHIAICIDGAMYMLEKYKGRSSAIGEQQRKAFYSACSNFRESVAILPNTNSVLTASSERAGSRPDMDRNNSVFRERVASRPVNISGEDDV